MRGGSPSIAWDSFFKPNAVAVIGASRNTKKFGYHVLAILQEHGFSQPIYPINPEADTIADLQCYRRLADAPPADLAVIAVPSAGVLGAFRDCVAHGVRAVVIVSSGFSETGEAGRELEQQLAEASRESGVPIIGPNCEGFVDNVHAVYAVIAGAMFEKKAAKGGVSIIAHSGAYTGYSFHEIASQGVGISKAISSGNEAVVGLPELLDMCERDEDTKAVLLHLEGVRDAATFRKAAQSLARKKPLVINHVGRNPQSAVVAGTHTAALAAPGRIFHAFYRQCGAVVTGNMEEMIDACVALAGTSRPAGRRIAIISFSGGVRVEMVDLLVEHDFEVPSFSPETEEKLKQFIPDHGNIRNPIDMADGLLRDPNCAAYSIGAAAADPAIDAIVVLLTVTRNMQIANSVVDAIGKVDKPVLVACTSQAVSAAAVELMRSSGIPVYASPRRLLNALNALAMRTAQERRWQQEILSDAAND